MKLTLIKTTGNLYNITDAVTKIEWSGSASSAARQLAFDYINAPYDNFGLPSISTGDLVSYEYGQEGEVFYGQIFGTEKSSAIGVITFTAFDMMKNLLESKGQYNFKNLPPETIAKMVCDDAQIPIRFLYPTGINIASLICNNMKLYDIIMAAYTKAHDITGDKYFPMIYKRGLGVYKTHWVVKGITLSDKDNLLEASIEETMDNIINIVKIYDDKGNQIGEVKDEDSLSFYGTYQEIYKQEKNVDPTTAAKTKLKVNPTQTIKLKCAGDINCLSCYYVYVNDTIINAVGRYWIKSDKHIWENGAYTMELELAFEAVMDKKEAEKETEKAKQEKQSVGSGGGATSNTMSASTAGSNMKPVANNKQRSIPQKNTTTSTLSTSGESRGGKSSVYISVSGGVHGGSSRKIESKTYVSVSGNKHGGNQRSF